MLKKKKEIAEMAEKSIKSNSLNFVTGPALLIFTYCTSPSQTLKKPSRPEKSVGWR